MRYTTKTGNKTSDISFISSISSELGNTARRANPHLFGLLSAIFYYFIGVFAFLSRSFFRIKLGERSFGLLTIISIPFFVWLGAYYQHYFASQTFLASDDLFTTLFKAFSRILEATFLLFFPSRNSVLDTLSLSTPVTIFGYIIFLVSIAHLIDVYRRKKNKEVIHTYFRGESVLFDRFKGKKIGNIEITQVRIWMIIEPLFIIIFALVFLLLEWYQLSLLLIISAICLFIEEYRVYKENKESYLNLIDRQLDGIYIRQVQKEVQDYLKATTEDKKYNASSSNKNMNSMNTMQEGSNFKYRAK